MRIVKRGKPPDKRVWAGTCRACRSEIEAEEHELNVEYDTRENGSFAHVKCPVCARNDLVMYPKDVKG